MKHRAKIQLKTNKNPQTRDAKTMHKSIGILCQQKQEKSAHGAQVDSGIQRGVQFGTEVSLLMKKKIVN